VGVNRYAQKEEAITDTLKIDETIRSIQIEKLKLLKLERNQCEVDLALDNLKKAAESTQNLMPFILTAVTCYATLGEIAGVLRNVFGEY
jgi:methylmalonyl-CoA mutase N-terminal domain/subunit